MKEKLLLITILLVSNAIYSQSKTIVGSWITRDTVNRIQFFINDDGTVEKRTATGNEDVWNKKPLSGTYTFSNNTLFMKWSDKTTETIKVKFIQNFAEFRLFDNRKKSSISKVFLKIVDEEVVPDK